MNITVESFDEFVSGAFDYDEATGKHTTLHLVNKAADVGGGTLTVEDIDVLKDYPMLDVVTVTGLHQDTFEYFVKTYGKQFRAIRFFKNRLVSDWSLLGELPQLEFVYFFCKSANRLALGYVRKSCPPRLGDKGFFEAAQHRGDRKGACAANV